MTTPAFDRAQTGPAETSRNDASHIDVAIVDDQALVRGGLGMLVDSQPDLTVTVQADNGRDAVEKLRAHPADVVLMDVRMPIMDGIAATARVLADHPETRVIVLTTFDLDEYVLRAIEAGASGFLLKDARPEELLTAIRTVCRGDAVISPSMTRRLLAHVVPMLQTRAAADAGARPPRSPAPADLPSTASARAAIATLTPREREVLVLMSEALSNAEIAARLHLSETTVKTHVGHVLMKLDARDRVQAVVQAFHAGIAAPAPECA
ncbi:response regulator transcription factor [Pseudoclavibacter sp. CFCC 14310]|uniref:response regulator transcription factor n=1 Tax=Pseudoclavibacter sp. CFCC 14310 TaxID=2615180 RepID=UPI0013012851|nr:response regulator transcription factor [Pseudoclavibacter sp. CFCC 14310]KAB1647431.1 response regulator transcription factor [Pseudoclavibacter sp. CFCC 14310]